MICSKCNRDIDKRGFHSHYKYCNGILKCKNCGVDLKGFQKKFCSIKCFALKTSPGKKQSDETRRKISLSLGGTGKLTPRCKICLNCGNKIKSLKFCNQHCQNEYRYKQFIKNWEDGTDDGVRLCGGTSSYIKRWLIEEYGELCSRCGWAEKNPTTGNIPIEIEHKDGNYKHNDKTNICLLCPNCHSLTSTFRALNVGKGRKSQASPRSSSR